MKKEDFCVCVKLRSGKNEFKQWKRKSRRFVWKTHFSVFVCGTKNVVRSEFDGSVCWLPVLSDGGGGGAMWHLASQRAANQLWDVHCHSEEWESHLSGQWGHAGCPGVRVGSYTGEFNLEHDGPKVKKKKKQTLICVARFAFIGLKQRWRILAVKCVVENKPDLKHWNVCIWSSCFGSEKHYAEK